MKRILLAGLIVLGARARAEEKFSQSVTPEDFSAAGLDLLSPAQRARLDALVSAFRSGTLATAQKAASEALAAKQAAEEQARAAEAQARAAQAQVQSAAVAAQSAQQEAKAAQAEASELRQSGLIAKAKALLATTPRTAETMIETTIPGKFRGWDGRAILTLANGQRWQVANSEGYYTPAIENPRVQVFPASVSGYWLRFPDIGMQVRVTLVGSP